jgi:hypothetical protein
MALDTSTSSQLLQPPLDPLSTKQGASNGEQVGRLTFGIKQSEEIPEPVATLLHRWFHTNKGILAPGAVAFHTTNMGRSAWIPSSKRRPHFQDRDGRKLNSQMYSLKKWLPNEEKLVLILWNEFQFPVIIKGLKERQEANPRSGVKRTKFQC